MVKFSELINASLEWTAAVTFRPVHLKKWLILTFVALMAGFLSGGFHFNLPSPRGHNGVKKGEAVQLSSENPQKEVENPSLVSPQEALKRLRDKIKDPRVFAAITIISLVVLLLFIIFTWLYSRFAFIFIEGVAKNDAAVRLPFTQHGEIANSLFWFTLAINAIVISFTIFFIFLCWQSLINAGIFTHGAAKISVLKALFYCLGYFSIFLLGLIILGLVNFLLKDFALIIMFKERIMVLPAFTKTFSIISRNKRDVVLYFLLKIGLAIGISIISGILYLAAFLGLLFPLGGIAIALYFFHFLLPGIWQVVYAVVLAVVGIPVLLGLSYILLCLYLPFAVFLRTLSLKFIAGLEPKYNLFRFIPAPIGK